MASDDWYEKALFTITTASLLLQGYVFFLIVKVSPKSMTIYCFFLISYTFWDLLFTLTLGYGLDVDMQAPSMCGGYVNGFAKYFGPNGGNIVVSILAFSIAALIYYMLYGLSYRYLAVQTDHKAIDYFLKPTSFVLLNILGLLTSLTVAVFVYLATTKPEFRLLADFSDFVIDLPQPQFAEQLNSIRNGTVAINFNPFLPSTQRMAAVMVCGFVASQLYSLGYGIATMRTIRENSKNFSAKTLKLHIQFTALLIVQMSTPIALIVFPLLFAVIHVLSINSIEKVSVNVGILLMSFYASTNSLFTILFISPYRKFTHKMLMCLIPNVWIFKRQDIKKSSNAKAIVFRNSSISIQATLSYAKQH